VIRCLNELIPRLSLQWCTPAQRWETRPTLDVDRKELHEEVRELRKEFQLQLTERQIELDYDLRFAIQSALTTRGLLNIKPGERC
jgi:hypothetical protein